LTNGFNLWFVFFSHLHSLDLVVAFGLLARPGLNGGQLDCGIQSELVLILEIEDSVELSGKPGPEVIQEKKPRQVEIALPDVRPHGRGVSLDVSGQHWLGWQDHV